MEERPHFKLAIVDHRLKVELTLLNSNPGC